MAKKDDKPDEPINVQTVNPPQSLSPEQAEIQALREELAKWQADYATQTAELAQAQRDKQNLQAQLTALQQAQEQPEKPATQDTRESVWVRSANGAEFWRGGVLFNGDWREIKRADVDEAAWQRIVSEPALQLKAQAD